MSVGICRANRQPVKPAKHDERGDVARHEQKNRLDLGYPKIDPLALSGCVRAALATGRACVRLAWSALTAKLQVDARLDLDADLNAVGRNADT